MEFIKGHKYKHYTRKSPRGTSLKKPTIRECTIVQNCEKYVTVDFGKYRESISKASLLVRDEWMERVI